MSDLVGPVDEQKHRELQERGRLDLLRLCPRCGMRSIGESDRACPQCIAFAERRREVTDADWSKAVADGLINPASKDRP